MRDCSLQIIRAKKLLSQYYSASLKNDAIDAEEMAKELLKLAEELRKIAKDD